VTAISRTFSNNRRISADPHVMQIELSLAESAKFDLRATTSRGEAQNDYGSPIQVETAGHLVSLKGSVGNGPSITMSTDRGRVTVKKESREGGASEGEVKPTKL